MSYDPVSGIQRWDIFYDPVYCDQIMKEAGRGRFIKVSDLPALIARIRADERKRARDAVAALPYEVMIDGIERTDALAAIDALRGGS